MNTTLIIRYGAGNEELERQRLGDDHVNTYALVLEWLWKNNTDHVEVQMINSSDVCEHCYTATPVE